MQGQEKTKRELDIEEYRNFFRKELFSGESIKNGSFDKGFAETAFDEMVKATQNHIYIEMPGIHGPLFSKTSLIALTEALKRKIDVKIVLNRQEEFSYIPEGLKEPVAVLKQCVRHNPYNPQDYQNIIDEIPFATEEGVQHGVMSFDGNMGQIHVTHVTRWHLMGPKYREFSQRAGEVIKRRWQEGREIE